MEIEIIKEVLDLRLMVVVIVVWLLCSILKNTPILKQRHEWLIPIIATLLGVLITPIYLAITLGEGWTDITLVQGMLQGVLVGGLAVYGNEMIKQIFFKRLEK